MTHSGHSPDRNPAVRRSPTREATLQPHAMFLFIFAVSPATGPCSAPSAVLSLPRHPSSKPLTVDPLCPIGVDSCLSPLADLSGSEYFLHRCPVGFDPSSVVAAISMRGNADLGEFEFRTTIDLADVKNCNRIVIRPPACRTPRLNNFLSGLQNQIDTRKVRTPGGEFSTDSLADLCLLSGKRLVLLGIHDHIVHLPRGSLECDRLFEGFGPHFVLRDRYIFAINSLSMCRS